MRWLSVLLVLGMACGDDSAPPPVPVDVGGRDGGTRDTGDELDAAPEDSAAEDAPAEDAPDSGSEEFDAGTDAGPPDGGFDPETCFDEEGIYDLCLCDTPTCSPDAPETCGDGTTCLPDGCGRTTCQLAGNRCESGDDCHPSSSCASLAFVPVCASGTDRCNDSRDCPLGFSCDEGTCTNRRVNCGDDSPCPWGFSCYDADEFVAQPYCRALYTPCGAFEICGPGFSCVDLDLDGDTECRPNGGFCDSNDDCPGEVCGADPVGVTDCRATHGPCTAGGCAAGFECVDLWGDGQTSCVATGGACSQQADCAEGSLCGAAGESASPSCIGG